MKRIAITLTIIISIGVIIYVGYRYYLPSLIAKTLTSSNSDEDYLPQSVKTKIEKIKKPVNLGANTIITTIHNSDITIEQILKAIDGIEEEKAYAMLDELNRLEIQNADQVFDLGKKYFPVDFDIEVFRKPFKRKFNKALLKKAIKHANEFRHSNEMDIETAKSVAKKILLQKEEEFNSIIKDN